MSDKTPPEEKPMAHWNLKPRLDPTRVDSPETRADKWSTDRIDRNPDNMALPPLHRRRGLSGMQKAAVGIGITAALMGGGAVALSTTNNVDKSASQAQQTPEAQPLDFIPISDLPLKTLPTERWNGPIAIKIDENHNLPVSYLSQGVADSDPIRTLAFWENIQTINNSDVTKAIESNGKTEIVLDSPLIDRSNDQLSIIVLGDGNEPIIFSASDKSAFGVVFVGEPNPKEQFIPVLPDSNALDYGKVSFQNSPDTS